MYSRVRHSAMCYPQSFGSINLQKKYCFLVMLHSFENKYYNSKTLLSEALFLKSPAFAFNFFFPVAPYLNYLDSPDKKNTDSKPWLFSHPF